MKYGIPSIHPQFPIDPIHPSVRPWESAHSLECHFAISLQYTRYHIHSNVTSIIRPLLCKKLQQLIPVHYLTSKVQALQRLNTVYQYCCSPVSTKFQDFSRTPKTFVQDSVVAQQCWITDKQQLLTLYIQCDSTVHRKTFITTSCKETVRLIHSRNTSYNLFTHGVLYIKEMLVKLNHR